ncbi:zinc-binding dehydrogenase [Microbacterium sp. AZCO]|uniref:zinc-binding dehydrogenase n=1 Tax=Microbacterium sp. AZCO TaxID=3142976 RepID=UPI0031F44681
MLINGAGGGAGSFAIQLAKAAGLHVTAVDSAAKLDVMRGLGADEVIDYRVQDFTRTGPYDLVVDLVASRSVFAYRRALAPRGRYFMVGGTTRTILRLLTLGTLVGLLTRTRLGILVVRQGPAHFVPLADRIVAGDVTVRVDSIHPLEAVPEALARHGEGRALGKVVIAVADEPQS